jgi:hypothetical protein
LHSEQPPDELRDSRQYDVATVAMRRVTAVR